MSGSGHGMRKKAKGVAAFIIPGTTFEKMQPRAKKIHLWKIYLHEWLRSMVNSYVSIPVPWILTEMLNVYSPGLNLC